MFSNWFSGDARAQYCASSYKQRMDQVGNDLVQLHYADEVLRQHLHEWLRFSKYLDERSLLLPDVSASTIHQYRTHLREERKPFPRSSCLDQNILETDEQGKFRRRVGSPPVTPAWFAPILAPYLQFVKIHRGLAPKTTRKYIQKLSAFALYLEGAGVKELGGITPRHVRDFYENAEGPARRSYGSTLRVFFRWAAVQSRLSCSLRDAVPRPRQHRYVNLPDVLGQAEQDRILGAVDRSTPLGRRDYAVLLLAARYGLRPCDIRQLTLDDIHWRDARIDLQQVKTGRQLVLPLLPDVADALSEYLREGRPDSKSRIIFIRHRAPFEPFAAENNLASIMRNALQRGGLAERKGRRGLYLFRHTLATRLLAAGHPLKAIADVLGHQSTLTTYGYIRVEVGGLRTVAIAEEEVTR